MWRWLFDAYRLLGIHLEIIDEQGTLITPASSASAELRNAVTASRNVEAFLTHETRASIVLASMSVSSTPIVADRAVAGAVLLAVKGSDAFEESHLARVGARWRRPSPNSCRTRRTNVSTACTRFRRCISCFTPAWPWARKPPCCVRLRKR